MRVTRWRRGRRLQDGIGLVVTAAVSLRTWLRRRPLPDRIVLVVTAVAMVAANTGNGALFGGGLYLGGGDEWFRHGRAPLVIVAIVALAAAMWLWARPAPDAVLRACLALAVVGLASSSAVRVVVTLAAWSAVHGVAVRLLFDLPSIAAPPAVKATSRVVAASFVLLGAALLAPFVASPHDLPAFWERRDPSVAAEWIYSIPVLVTLAAACAAWCVRRFARSGRRHGSSFLGALGALAFGVAFTAVVGYAYPPFFLTSALVLPLTALTLVVAEYGMEGQVRRLSRIVHTRSTPAELETVLRSELEDPALRLLLRVQDSERFVDVHGRHVDVDAVAPDRRIDVKIDGSPIAAIVADPTIARSTSRRAALVGVAKLAIERAQLQARVLSQMNDIAESRRRLVEAADRGRRDVERDLHDGAQQRLAALTLSLRMAATAARSEEVALLAKSTAEELHTAVTELQELARGIHPAVLTDAGLAAAVESLAERSAIPVAVRVVDRRFPPAVELTSYFVVAEALTNVTKHAGATAATVTVTEEGGWLRVAVADDGRGGAVAGAGSGLVGLYDRVSALGGRLEVDSTTGRGTTVEASLPLDPRDAGGSSS